MITYPEQIIVERDGTLLGETGNSAWFNPARTHRYLLTRSWSPAPLMTWLLLNPVNRRRVR